MGADRVVAAAVPGLVMGPGVRLVPPHTAIMLLNPPERHRRMRPEPPSVQGAGQGEGRGSASSSPPCPELARVLRPRRLQCPRVLCSAQPQLDGTGEAEPWPVEDTESVLGLATSPRACPWGIRVRSSWEHAGELNWGRQPCCWLQSKA